MKTLKDIAYATRASQNKRELTWLLEHVADNPPRARILEIGSWRGWLLQTFAEAFPEATVYGIEEDAANVDPENTAPLLVADSQLDETRDLVKSYFVDKSGDMWIDFLFIDGNHLYDAVKRDFELYSPLVRKGGIIAFHDVGLFDNPGVEVYKFYDEVTKLPGVTKWEAFQAEEDSSSNGLDGKGTGTGIIWI